MLANEEMGTTAVDSFLAAAAGGVHGMIDDYVTCCTAWGFDLRDVPGEVHVWHGERDRFVPVEHARALAAALPRCRAQFDAHDGHFFFRRRVAEVLGALVAAARRGTVLPAGGTVQADMPEDDDPLDRLSAQELHDLALRRARRHLDVAFFWHLLQVLPAAEAAAGEIKEAEADVERLSAHLDDLTDSGQGETAELLRPFYLDYLRRHGVKPPA